MLDGKVGNGSFMLTDITISVMEPLDPGMYRSMVQLEVSTCIDSACGCYNR